MKRLFIIINLLLLVSCGGGNSGQATGDQVTGQTQAGSLAGNWKLQLNGCNGILTFPQDLSLVYAGTVPASSATDENESELYDLEGDGVPAGARAQIVTAEKLGGYCLNPVDALIGQSCTTFCEAAISGTVFSGNCKYDSKGDACGPVTYKKN